MENPFVYGQEVSGDTFCNRTNEIKELISDIKSGQNVIIYSPRRYGKTSLIKKVLDIISKEDILSVYVNLYAVLKEEDFITAYATAVAKALSGPLEKIVNNLKSIFKSIRPKIVLNPQGETEFGIELVKDMDIMIEDVANAVIRYSEKHKKRVVVVFDEFQQIGSIGTDRIERKLRGIVQAHGRKISYIFMGSKKHLIYNMFSNPERPFYKTGRHFPLGKINPEEFTSFVIERFNISGKSISKDLAGKIVEVAECHPYYVQHLSSSVWKRSDKVIDGKTIEDALTVTLAEENSAYVNLWDEFSLNQKKTLTMIANSSQKYIYSIEMLNKYNLTASTVQKTIKSLMMKGIIKKSNSFYEITDVFFKIWLLRITR